jgi:hypothetical protein
MSNTIQIGHRYQPAAILVDITTIIVQLLIVRVRYANNRQYNVKYTCSNNNRLYDTHRDTRRIDRNIHVTKRVRRHAEFREKKLDCRRRVIHVHSSSTMYQ